MTKGRDKGANFEREFAKKLSLWWSENADAHIFARRSASGGAGRDIKGQSGHAGDIFADKPEGQHLTDQIVFELKAYQDLSKPFWRFFAGEESVIDKFLEQTKKAAEPYNRPWALVMKSNRLPILVITNSPVFKAKYKRFGVREYSVLPLANFLTKATRNQFKR